MTTVNRSEIARKVRNLRAERHLTQAELSKVLGLSQGRYSEIERGKGSFTAEQFLELLRRFNVPASFFVTEKIDAGSSLQNALARLGRPISMRSKASCLANDCQKQRTPFGKS